MWRGFKFNCNFDSVVKIFRSLFSENGWEGKGIWVGLRYSMGRVLCSIQHDRFFFVSHVKKIGSFVIVFSSDSFVIVSLNRLCFFSLIFMYF